MRFGVITAIVAAVMFGVSAPIIAWAGRGAFATACLLYAGAALVGHGARIVRRDRAFSLRRADAPRLVAIALAGAAVAPVLLVVGLERAGALTSSLLLNLEAVFTVVLAAVIRREVIGGRVWIAVAAMASAGAALSLDAAARGTGGVIGAVAVIGATLAWALDNTLTQPLSDRRPFDVVAAKATLGAALTGVLALAFRETWPDVTRALVLLSCGATAYGLSLALYILAQRRIGAARTGSVFALAPFIGALVAWLAGERTLGTWAFAAIALFALGVWLHLSEQHRHLHHHAALAHDHAHRHDDGHHMHAHDPPVTGEHSHPHDHHALDHDHPHDHGAPHHAHDHA
ncbi:MAG TPA: DMT family transporter [Kofleriaceae bacterium]|nr:DMT family transporter [Kofleriaceae bacterium]